MPLTLAQVHDRLTSLLADMDSIPVVNVATNLINVPVGANLDAIMANAAIGAVLSLATGFVYTGALTVNKSLSFVTATPTANGRANASLVGPTIVGLVAVTAPDVTFRGIKIQGSTKENTLFTTGPHTTLDQCTLIGSANGQHRGVAVNSADCAITQCYIANIWASQDSQAISGWDGTANLVVDNCYLEASGENVLFGGADPLTTLGTPTGIVIKNCNLFKPLAWKGAVGMTIKNLFELKNCKHVTFANNVCENNWLNGQTGTGLVLTVRNQDGAATWSTIEDVVVDGNIFRHVGSGIQILGRDNLHPSQIMNRVVISNNSFEDINPGVWGGAGYEVYMDGGPMNLTLANNTFAGTGLNSALSVEGVPCIGLIVTGNKFQEGDYGMHNSNTALGKAVLDLEAPGYLWANNTIVKGSSGRNITYPVGTTVI